MERPAACRFVLCMHDALRSDALVRINNVIAQNGGHIVRNKGKCHVGEEGAKKDVECIKYSPSKDSDP